MAQASDGRGQDERRQGGGLRHAGTSGFGLGGPGAAPPRQGPPPKRRPPQAGPVKRGFWTRNATLIPLGILVFLVVAVVSAGVASGWSAPGYHESWHFLNFFTGVFALVALSISVMIGLAAADQLVLAPRQRVLAQAVHRAAAFTAVIMMIVHVICKIASGKIGVMDAFVPFMASYHAMAIGLGVVAAYLMILVSVTGIVRGGFATRQRPWVWRALHATAYLCWPPAIIHGLLAGRHAATWVALSYIFCVLAVVLALPTRLITKARAGRP